MRFSRPEKALGLVRDLDVPLASVTETAVVPDGRSLVRGWRVGTWVPGLLLLGVWRRHGRRQLVALRRGQQALHVRLTGERYDELLIGDPVAVETNAALSRVRGEP